MPRVVWFVCCAMAMMLGAEARASASSQDRGQVQGVPAPARLDPPVFEAGRVGLEDLIEARFDVVNPTRETLEIVGFRTTCKCTAPTISERFIPPGGSVEVSAVVDLRGTPARINKSFFLMFRGYDKPLECSIRATMGSAVEADPVHTRTLTGRIILRSADGRPFTPLKLHNEGVEAVFTALRPAGRERAVEWAMDYRLPSGITDNCLVIETDHKKAPVVAIRVLISSSTTLEVAYIKQRQEIYSQRTHAVLGALEVGDSVELGCQIRRPSHDEPLELRTETEGLEAEILRVDPMPTDDGYMMYTIRVTNTGLEEGGVLAPLYMRTPDGFETRFWMIGVARASAAEEADVDGE